MTPAQIRRLRERISRAHLAIRAVNFEPHDAATDCVVDAITELGGALLEIVDELAGKGGEA